MGAMRHATFVDRLIAADPGLTRLYLAARATAAVAVGLAVMLAVARREHLSLVPPMLAAAIGLNWSLSVNDRNPKDQRLTTLAAFPAAALALTLGTLIGANRIWADVCFVVLLFTGVQIRTYGPRGFAIGMIAIMSYFFVLFLRAPIAELPWLLLALLVATLSTYLARFIILPDQPQYALANAAAAFRSRQRLIAETIDAAARTGWTFRLERALNHHVFRLNETAIALDDILAEADDSDRRSQVLDAELRTAQIAERARVTQASGVEIPELRLQPPAAPLGQNWTPRGLFRAGTQIETAGLSTITRQAIQLSVAAIGAIVVGEIVSPQRWYWAALTALLVFSGTTSIGDTLLKAWSRVAGTALGVLASLAIGIATRGEHAAAFALLFVFLFIAVYAQRLSYAFMTFGITGMLSLLYVFLGYFSDQLMLLRLAETLIGAAFGGVAATFVLPIRTTAVITGVENETLARLQSAVDATVRRLHGDDGADVLAAVRAYDEAFQSVRAFLVPFIYSLRLSPNQTLRRRLLLFAACGYHLRALARLALESPQSADARARAMELVARIDRATAELRSDSQPQP
jgi:hypothetical protein